MPSIGVLAVQGDFQKHWDSLLSMGCSEADLALVRTPEQLNDVARLIIPGGESTTVGLLLKRYGLGEAIQERARQGMPIWGTCMGMIMMAKDVVGSDQYRLGILDVSVERNAFGAQVESFESELTVNGIDEPVLGVFIRAPVVTRYGESVQPLAEFDGKVVAVREGALLGTSFHPELTPDTRFHKLFLDL